MTDAITRCVVALLFAAALVGAAMPAIGLDASLPRVSVDYDEQASAARVSASIDIKATPQTVYAVMIDCSRALRIVTGLESCRVIERDAAGKWDVREHIVAVSAILPRVRNVFRSDYDQNRAIRFHRVDGDMRVSEGEWRLEPLAGGAATRVSYHSRVASYVPIPALLVRQAIEHDIPNVLIALRRECLEGRAK